MNSFWRKTLSIVLCTLGLSCQPKKENSTNMVDSTTQNFNFLALGDSYTIGESVCDTCRWPAQLKASLIDEIPNSEISLSIIAQTGWTTTDLLQAISEASPSNDNNLVSLLIGVNNQYQGKPFSIYETEFVQLLDIAIEKAGGNKTKVMVVSIPDYAFTPFGQAMSNPNQITSDIIEYNTFAESVCTQRGISFVNITDITQEGLNDPSLVATDGLHPSEAAYTLFVERLISVAKLKLID